MVIEMDMEMKQDVKPVLNRFYLKFGDATLFKKQIDYLSQFHSELRLSLSKEGIKAVTMDPANVMMSIWDIKVTNLIVYNFSGNNGDDMYTLGIRVNDFKSALKEYKKGSVTLEYTIETNKITMVISNGITLNFTIPVIEIDDKDQKIPELNYPGEIWLNSKDFQAVIKNTKEISETVKLSVNSDKQLILLADGETNTLNTVIPTKLVNVTDPVTCKYAVDYLSKISNYKRDTLMKIEFKTDYPMKLMYDNIRIILAPRVSNED